MEEPGPYPCAASAADMLEALLVWRRDVRHFLARPIPENEMERLFALAQLAPSVGNAQPWRYLRVRSAFVRGALADHVDEAARPAGPTSGTGDRAAPYASRKLHGLTEAPEILAVFYDQTPAAGQGTGLSTMTAALRYSNELSVPPHS